MRASKALKRHVRSLITVLQRSATTVRRLVGPADQRRAVVFTLILVASLFTPFTSVGTVSAVSPDVNIDNDDSDPPLGTELTAGKEYTFDFVISYNLDDGESGVIKLYLPDAGGLKETREVTGTGSYEDIAITVTETVPEDMAGENFIVSVILESADGDFLEGDDGTYPVVEPVSKPSVSTTGSSDVGETSAQLEGSLDDTGGADSVDVWFEYREEGANSWQSTTKESYGSTTTFDIQVSGLSSGTTYEFRAVAENNAKTVRGSTQTFTTDEPVTGSVDIIGGDSDPSSGTELEAGEEYDFQIKTDYEISGSSGTLELIFSWTSGVETSESVSEGSGEVTLSSTGTVPDEAQTVEVSVFLYDSDENRLDLDSIEYDVASNGVPTIDSYSPSDTTLEITEGDSVDFSVDVSDPDGDDLTTEWYVDELNDDQGFEKAGSGTSYSRTFDNSGDYAVEVRVSDGETTTKQQWTIEVEKKNQDRDPSISRVSPDASEITVQDGDSQVFEVEASDTDGDINGIRWFVDGEKKETDSVDGMESLTRSFEYTFTDPGTHAVKATVFDSNKNTDSLSWTVHVEGVGSAPTIRTGGVGEKGQTYADVTGHVDDLGGADSIDIYWEIREKGENQFSERGRRSVSNTGQYSNTFSNLEPGTTYEFRAAAENDIGTDKGGTKSFTTGKPDLEVVDIRWSPEIRTEGEEIAFSVEVRNNGGTPVSDADLELRLGSDLYQATGIDLEAGETDTLSVTESWTADPEVDEVTVEIDPDNEVEEVDETNNQRTESLDFGQGTGVIAGTVTDADGNPVQGATVTLKTGRTTTTGSNGEFGFEEVAIGQHQLTVTKDGFQDAETRVAIEAEDLVTPEIALEGEAAGVITAIEGVPHTYTENEWFEVRVTVRNTGATGQTYTVEAPVPSGVNIDGSSQRDVSVDIGETDTVTYRVQYYGTETVRGFTAELYSESGELLDEQSVESQPRETVSFTVAAELPGDQPISDATVKLIEGAQAQEVREQQTNEDGEVTFEELPSDRYAVQVIANNIFGNDKVKRAKVIEVGPEGTTHTTFTIQLAASFSGTVVTEDGEPVENAEVVVGGKSTLTNSDGEFEFEGGLPSRKHVVEVYLDGNLVWQKEMQLQAGPNQHLLEVPPEPGRAEIFSEALLNEMRGAVYGDYGIKHDKPGSDTIPYFLGWLGYSVAPYVDLPADARDCMVWIPGDEVWDTADCGSLGLSIIGLGVITAPAEAGEQLLDVASKTAKFVAHAPEKTPEVVKILSQKLGNRFEEVLAKIDERAPDTADKLRKAHLRHKTGLTGKQLDEAARLNRKGVSADVIEEIPENGGNLEKTIDAGKNQDEVIWLEQGRLDSAADSSEWVYDGGGSGWKHIRNNHMINPDGNQFLRYGDIYSDETAVQDLIITTIKKGNIYTIDDSIWYVYQVQGSGGKKISVLVGDNGYIVTVRPSSVLN